MAESPDAVISFLEDLSIRIRGKADEVKSTACILLSVMLFWLLCVISIASGFKDVPQGFIVYCIFIKGKFYLRHTGLGDSAVSWWALGYSGFPCTTNNHIAHQNGS